MMCAWNGLLAILPRWMHNELTDSDRINLQEVRLRVNGPPELVGAGTSRWLIRDVTVEDISFCVNTASRYSPWNAASTAQGYLTAQGGHRIGICGEAVIQVGKVHGIRQIRSLCIRIARDIPGIAYKAANLNESILIIGAPGWGKTTLLRDLIRQISDLGAHVSVVDERGELFPQAAYFREGKCTDILTGCRKQYGIEMLLRTMGPQYIAVDEITEEVDCEALVRAGWCGVKLLATAHAGSMRDLKSRAVYKPLIQSGIFTSVLIMNRDKSWSMERLSI